MPSKTPTDLIREHGELLRTLEERVDSLARRLDGVESSMDNIRRESAAFQIRLTTLQSKSDDARKLLDEVRTRRFTILSTVFLTLLGSVIGGLITVGGQILIEIVKARAGR